MFLVEDRRGRVSAKLLDFGVAKLLDQEPGSVTHTGAQIGTPLFMAPEQWAAEPIDHRTDVYALGIIVHNMFTGRYPFEASSPVTLMNMHANQAPTLPSAHGGPATLDPIVARALAKDRLARPQSAGELYSQVAAALRDAPAAAVSPSPPRGAVRAPLPTPPAPSAVVPITTLGASSGSRDELDVVPRSRLGPVIAALAGLAVVIAAVVAIARSRGEALAVPADAMPSSSTHAGPGDTTGASGATPMIVDAGTASVEPPPRAVPADARIAPRPIDARPAGGRPAADARRSAPGAGRPDASLPPPPSPPPDAAPVRAPADSGWGQTVNPFGDRPR